MKTEKKELSYESINPNESSVNCGDSNKKKGCTPRHRQCGIATPNPTNV
jgi:hypothetical protein